jgi:class 3 adenylate cyclase
MLLLIVDDNPISRAMLSRQLSHRGYDTETAETGELALQALSRRKFDLILLDVLMPGLSGMEVLRKVRETMSMSELPVIMITARDGSSDVVEALECGANDYVIKPIDLAVLLARANTQLALKAANQRIRNLAMQLETRNKFIKETFGRYLTDEVVEELLTAPEGLALGGASRTVTILMSDLRGFSSLAERLSPPQVLSLLNHYLGAMTQVILRHGGTIDEFIGDGILVIFGAPVARPDDATRAVACALEMQLSIRSVNEHLKSSDLPEIEMGIGINTGEVVVGNIGSDRRAKYGVVGRHVNLASRIEALTVGGQVLISESTRDAVGSILDIGAVTEVSLKGARDVMRIFDVRGIAGPYGFLLPQEQVELVLLRAPMPIEFAVFDGVTASTRLLPARISRLSPKEAVILTNETIAPMSLLKMRFADDRGGFFGEDIYGKVIGMDGRGGYRVHFTAMPPEMTPLLSFIAQES